jgi:hypothetical protein
MATHKMGGRPQQPATPQRRVAPPLPVGVHYTIPDAKLLPPQDRALLKSLDWKEGDPIPSDLPEILAGTAAVNALVDEYTSDDDRRIPQIAEQSVNLTEVALNSLPAEHREEVEAFMQDVQTELSGDAKKPKPVISPPRVSPSVREQAKQALLRAKSQQTRDIAAQQANSEFAGVDPGVRRVLENTEVLQESPDEPEEPQEAAAQPKAADTGLSSAHTHCLRCGFPADKPDLVDVTESDKLSWLQSMVGDQPFRKTFSMYGGRVTVTLRLLTPSEQDMITAQQWRDLAEERYAKPDYIQFQERYIIAMSLVAVRINDDDYQFPERAEGWQVDDEKDRVRSIYQYVYAGEGPLKSTPLARIVSQSLRDFFALTNKLEAMAYAADF